MTPHARNTDHSLTPAATPSILAARTSRERYDGVPPLRWSKGSPRAARRGSLPGHQRRRARSHLQSLTVAPDGRRPLAGGRCVNRGTQKPAWSAGFWQADDRVRTGDPQLGKLTDVRGHAMAIGDDCPQPCGLEPLRVSPFGMARLADPRTFWRCFGVKGPAPGTPPLARRRERKAHGRTASNAGTPVVDATCERTSGEIQPHRSSNSR